MGKRAYIDMGFYVDENGNTFVDQSFSAPSGGIGGGVDASAAYPGRFQQTEQTQGVFIFSPDSTLADEYIHQYFRGGAYNRAYFVSTNHIYFDCGADSNFVIQAGGTVQVQDGDASDAVRVVIETTSPITYGRIRVPANEVALAFGASYQGKLSFDGTNVVFATTTGVFSFTGGSISARIQPRVVTGGTSGTLTPNSDTTDNYNALGLDGAVTFAAPTGTPTDWQDLAIRIRDDGTGRALTWNAIYRVVGQTLPATTTAGKLIYVGLQYNLADAKWDVVAKTEET